MPVNNKWNNADNLKKPERKSHEPLGKKIVGTLNSALEAVDDILGHSSERQSRQRVYLNIAHFMQRQSESDLQVCLSAVYLVCGEDDKELLRKNPRSPEAEKLAETARKHILTVQVHYEKMDNQNNYLCQTEIYHIQNDIPTVYRAKEQMNWDYLPAKVRERIMREGINKVSIKLFPQE